MKIHARAYCVSVWPLSESCAVRCRAVSLELNMDAECGGDPIHTQTMFRGTKSTSQAGDHPFTSARGLASGPSCALLRAEKDRHLRAGSVCCRARAVRGSQERPAAVSGHKDPSACAAMDLAVVLPPHHTQRQ